ncbi:hypothetical protein KY290_037964 [Solanum tuberosum]|uniref:Uncharacterized protein n=1 Tax=Solanum tuberosum TaxID=4113 RepID=A0ABQ7TYA3_SOLTU|nr:hypothetical protein KY285_037320 [Solanum tuberosum]KAH0739259.1 hypothetical protein KY290_037964 [Solanum tuberosum]
MPIRDYQHALEVSPARGGGVERRHSGRSKHGHNIRHGDHYPVDEVDDVRAAPTKLSTLMGFASLSILTRLSNQLTLACLFHDLPQAWLTLLLKPRRLHPCA